MRAMSEGEVNDIEAGDKYCLLYQCITILFSSSAGAICDGFYVPRCNVLHVSRIGVIR